MRYWVVVVSKDHILDGIAGGFIMANHGKPGPLKRMAVNDWVICYSPKQTMGGTDSLQAFTAIGQVAGKAIYPHKMSDDFIPYRRNITYNNCREAPIAPLINHLDFIKDKRSWGYQFRRGFFEISAGDFNLISKAMEAGNNQ